MDRKRGIPTEFAMEYAVERTKQGVETYDI